MENVEFDNFAEKINDLNEYDEISFDISYIDNSTNKQSKLIKNEDVNFAYELRSKQYQFRFKQPLLISLIDIKSKSNDLKGLIVEVVEYGTNEIKRITLEKYNKYQYVSVKINKIITSFSIIPPESKNKIELSLIEIHGFDLEKLKNSLDSFKLHDDAKNELNELYSKYKSELEKKEIDLSNKEVETNQKLEKLEEEIESSQLELDGLNEKLIDLKSTIKTNESKNAELTQENHLLVKTRKDLEEKINSIKNNIQERESELKKLNSTISTLKQELKKLNEDKSLMAYELKEFVREANVNIAIYLVIGVILIIGIIALTFYLFNGAADLTFYDFADSNSSTSANKSIDTNNKVDIIDILLSRLPFVIITTTIIISLYELAKIFIKKSMNIQNQKMNLSKIGIISKDVSDTSADNLEITDEELYEYRTKLKMDILKEYLKKDIDMDFDYKINQGLISKIKDYLTTNKSKDGK